MDCSGFSVASFFNKHVGQIIVTHRDVVVHANRDPPQSQVEKAPEERPQRPENFREQLKVAWDARAVVPFGWMASTAAIIITHVCCIYSCHVIVHVVPFFALVFLAGQAKMSQIDPTQSISESRNFASTLFVDSSVSACLNGLCHTNPHLNWGVASWWCWCPVLHQRGPCTKAFWKILKSFSQARICRIY